LGKEVGVAVELIAVGLVIVQQVPHGGAVGVAAIFNG